MSKEELKELSIKLYNKTIHMLDYDLTGLTFNEEIQSKRLLGFLFKTDGGSLNKCNEDEFLFVKENYILQLQEYSQINDSYKEEVDKLIGFVKHNINFIKQD